MTSPADRDTRTRRVGRLRRALLGTAVAGSLGVATVLGLHTAATTSTSTASTNTSTSSSSSGTSSQGSSLVSNASGSSSSATTSGS